KLIENQWTIPDTISQGMFGSLFSEMIFDHNNRLYVFWYRPERFYYRYFENNSWSEIICPYENNNYHVLSNTVADSANNLHCIGSFHYSGQSHYDDRAIYFKYNYGSQTWTDPILFGENRNYMGLDIDLDSLDFPRITWGQYNNDTALPPPNATYYSYYNGDTWSDPEFIVENNAEDQQIAIDQSNSIHICNREDPISDSNKAIPSVLVHYEQQDNGWIKKIIKESENAIAQLKMEHHQNNLLMSYVGCYDDNGENACAVYFTKFELYNNINDTNNPINEIHSFPNPFTQYISINYNLKHGGNTTIYITDVFGHLVFKSSSNKMNPGQHVFTWNGTDLNGKPCEPGGYFCFIESGTFAKVVKIIKKS
ncbi:MAG: T9SS type A sorting domain-containing protein, partial [Cyclobacteriaceae bacterium]